MNRKLLVSLLRKNIEELEMITDGFMEIDVYPKMILLLAKRKTEDIQSIIEQLGEIKTAVPFATQVEPEAKAAEPEIAKPVEKPVEPEVPLPEAVETIVSEDVPEPEIDEQPEPDVTEFPASEPETKPSSEPEAVSETETVKVVELEETIELLDNIELLEVFDNGTADLKTIELDDIEEKATTPEIVKQPAESTDIHADSKLQPVKASEPSEPVLVERKESRVEELLLKTTSEEIKIITLADKIAPSKFSRSDKLSQTDNSFSALIANKKIDDIKQAISIGDRFRFQRELFGGNGEDMNKTLNYINQLASLEEVTSFLQNKYKWALDDDDVVDFMQIVKRKFI